jgi:hypothetical protein
MPQLVRQWPDLLHFNALLGNNLGKLVHDRFAGTARN